MKFFIPLLFVMLTSCAGGTTPPAEEPAGEQPAGEQAAVKEAGGLGWCVEGYGNTPCVFRVYGRCLRRDCVGAECNKSGYARWRCPAGDGPAFMDKQLACGRRSHEPVVPQEPQFTYSPDCGPKRTRWANVAHEDRICRSDGDCTMVRGNCFSSPLNQTAAARPEMQETTCGDPRAGACPADDTQAVCRNGCCVAEGGGFGPVEPVYPRIAPP